MFGRVGQSGRQWHWDHRIFTVTTNSACSMLRSNMLFGRFYINYPFAKDMLVVTVFLTIFLGWTILRFAFVPMVTNVVRPFFGPAVLMPDWLYRCWTDSRCWRVWHSGRRGRFTWRWDWRFGYTGIRRRRHNWCIGWRDGFFQCWNFCVFAISARRANAMFAALLANGRLFVDHPLAKNMRCVAVLFGVVRNRAIFGFAIMPMARLIVTPIF